MVLISIAAAAAAKYFGSRRHHADGHGDHPVVRAMFRAVNEGEFDALAELIDDDCRFYVNAHPLTRHEVDRGPALWVETLKDLRVTLPGVEWELYDELAAKDDGTRKVAIRYVSRSLIDEQQVDFEVAGFGRLADGKLVEWRQVADLTTYNLHRSALGQPAVGEG